MACRTGDRCPDAGRGTIRGSFPSASKELQPESARYALRDTWNMRKLTALLTEVLVTILHAHSGSAADHREIA
jgi:hypothetical protein